MVDTFCVALEPFLTSGVVCNKNPDLNPEYDFDLSLWDLETPEDDVNWLLMSADVSFLFVSRTRNPRCRTKDSVTMPYRLLFAHRSFGPYQVVDVQTVPVFGESI